MKIFKIGTPWMLSLLLGLLLISGCKDDDNEMPSPANPNQAVNDWIYANMDTYYLWTDQLPDNPDYTQDPTSFFENLKSSQDRFSRIVPNYQDLINSLNGITLEAGYEFVLLGGFLDPGNVEAMILYVKKGSPAEAEGLLRGDVITHINGVQMTEANYRDLLGDMSADHEVTFERFNTESSDYEVQAGINLTVEQVLENPNHIAEVIEADGQKIGYFMYNLFTAGTGNNKVYDDEMDQIFADFKAQGINQLILDLRYNSGGLVSSATNLASLIAPNVTAENIFYENIWNDELQTYIESLSDGDDILRGKFEDKVDNLGAQLSGQTIYILVGSRTASASELMINGLFPYMDVVIIGEETVGKNVGSIPIEDDQNAENDYGILPIVFQTYNSDGQSEYANGFTPTGDNFIEEFRQLPLEPLGDVSDPLVERALDLMGVSITGRTGSRMAPDFVKASANVKGFSLDRKPRSNRMILPAESLPKLEKVN